MATQPGLPEIERHGKPDSLQKESCTMSLLTVLVRLTLLPTTIWFAYPWQSQDDQRFPYFPRTASVTGVIVAAVHTGVIRHLAPVTGLGMFDVAQMEVLWFWHSYLFHAYLQHSRGRPGAREPVAYWITQLAGFLPVIIDTAVHLVYPDIDTPRDFLIDLFVGLSLVLVYPVSLVPVATGFFPQGRRILSTLETNASFAPPLARQAILTLFIGLSWSYRPYLLHRTPQTFQYWYLGSALPQWEGAAFAIAHSLLAVAVLQSVPSALTRQTQAYRPWTFLH